MTVWITPEMTRPLRQSDVSPSVWADFKKVSGMEAADAFVKKHDYTFTFAEDGNYISRPHPRTTFGQKVWDEIRASGLRLPARPNPDDEKIILRMEQPQTKKQKVQIFERMDSIVAGYARGAKAKPPRPPSAAKLEGMALKKMSADERRAYFKGKAL